MGLSLDHSLNILIIILTMSIVGVIDMSPYVRVERRRKPKQPKPLKGYNLGIDLASPLEPEKVKQRFLTSLEVSMHERYFVVNYFKECQDLHDRLTVMTPEQLNRLPDISLLMEGYLRHRELNLMLEPKEAMGVFKLMLKTLKEVEKMGISN